MLDINKTLDTGTFDIKEPFLSSKNYVQKKLGLTSSIL